MRSGCLQSAWRSDRRKDTVRPINDVKCYNKVVTGVANEI